jgi:hypothetical protein
MSKKLHPIAIFHRTLHFYYNGFEKYNRRSNCKGQSRTRRKIYGGKVIKINSNSNSENKIKTKTKV